MPTLITLSDIKTKIPEWEKYVRLKSEDTTQQLDDRLTTKAEDAEAHMLELLPDLKADTITPALTRHLIVMIKREVFLIQHGDRQWGEAGRPQILRDYQDTLNTLQRYREGDLSYKDTEEPQDVRMNAPKRRFDNGKWFHPDYLSLKERDYYG